ncbi:abortive infection family protein [Providencia rustigianii]|uniref:abortive infection family protein n=1 Tax=Providencia rustigianii TaxID=158850 RepID=UPI00223F8919|nr:abortive infection family protein [Providencia rustigianii]
MTNKIEFNRKEEMLFAKAMMNMNSGQVEELLVNCDREDLLENGRILNDFIWQNDNLQSTCNIIIGEILSAGNLRAIWDAGSIQYNIRNQSTSLHNKVESFLDEEDEEDETVDEIPIPELQKSTVKVLAALRDAERAIQDGHPENSVDRFHTAFHGHLKEMCDEQSLQYDKDPRVDELFKLLLDAYKQKNNLSNTDDAYKLMRSFSPFFAQLNTIRNHSTLSHATGKLLDSATALLFVNFSKTALTFIIEKFK